MRQRQVRSSVSSQLVITLLITSLFYGPLLALQPKHVAAAAPKSTLHARNFAPSLTTFAVAWRRLAGFFQASVNLDTLRGTTPQPPNTYQPWPLPTPGPGYDDPKPVNTANYDAYLTVAVQPEHATGPVGALPLQAPDPTVSNSVTGGLSVDLLQRRFNFAVPVLGLAGRAGLGMSLALSYSSNSLWQGGAAGGAFNVDRGFPAPGWRLGFGALLVRDPVNGVYYNSVTQQYSIIYLAPDGTRHDLRSAGGGVYESYDGSYLQFNSSTQVLSFPNGTKLQFGAYSYSTNNYDYLALPTSVIDRNGNYLTIAYKTLTYGSNNDKQVLDYVTDTAGRRIDFEYQNNRLTGIKQNRNGSWFYFVRLDYVPVTLQTDFTTTDPALPNGTPVWLLGRITYPTGASLRFTFNNYGQISGIAKWAPAISGQGGERQIAATTFGFSGTSVVSRNESAENWTGITYNYVQGVQGLGVTDNLERRHEAKLTGLTYEAFTFTPNGDSYLKRTITTYQQDAGLSYRANPRPVASEIWDTTNGGPSYTIRKASTQYQQFYGMWLPVRQDDQPDGSGGSIRYTLTTYKHYPAQRILGLPETVEVHQGGSGALFSKVQNNYDETGSYTDSNNVTVNYLQNAAGAVQHDDTNYGSGFTTRGNLTSVTQFNVSAAGSRIVKRANYDTTGNLLGEADAAGNRKQIAYTDNYSNKPAGVTAPTLVYPSLSTSPETNAMRGGTQYDYYNGNVLKSFHLAAGSSTEQQLVTTSYDFADRPVQTTKPDGGWVRTDYWDNLLVSGTAQQIESGKVRFKWELMDGAGRAFKKASDHPDGVSNKYAGQLFAYDKFGRVKDSSNVLAVNSSFTPTAEDAAAGWLFTTITYDTFSRMIMAQKPDNNTVEVDYEGCGCAGNMTKRVTDELGNYTETKTDLFGRLAEALEPNPQASDGVYSKAVYFYDTLDRLVKIEHRASYSWTYQQTPTQVREFSYDGYGRLASETTPEAGTVSYTYTTNDQLASSTNANGKTTTYTYDKRNLPTTLAYSDSTPGVGYQYDAWGARTQMTDGEGQTAYSYNSYRQLQSETRTFSGLTGKVFGLSYAYNQAEQVKQVVYSGQASGSAAPLEELEQRTLNNTRRTPGQRVGPSSLAPIPSGSSPLNLTASTNAALLVQAAQADFDGDGKSDFSVWRPSDGYWYVKRSSDGNSQLTLWGTSGDVIVPGDYDGDDKTDHAVWRPSDGNWYVKRSSDGNSQVTAWGTTGDQPVPGDYDGDGKTDLAVFRPSDGNWYVKRSSDGNSQITAWGLASDLLAPSDYDGDGKTDIAVWRPSQANWYIKRSSDSQSQVTQWGSSAASDNDQPVPADYDGDGKTDLTVFRRSTSTWHILKSSNSATQSQAWGVGSDWPTPGDYDGDGKADIAVWRPSNGTFYVVKSSNGAYLTQAWGQAGDIPILSSGIPTPAPLGNLTISGQVTNAQGGGGLGGVVMTLSGSLGIQTVTDSNGNYSFTGLASGSNYTVSPTQNGYSLTPGSRTYQNLTANITNANFSGVAVTPPSNGFPFSKTINYAYNNVGALSGVGTNLLGTDATNTTNVINGLQFKAFGAIKQLNYGNGLQLTMGYNANRQQPITMKVGPNGTGSIINYTYEYYDGSGHNNNRIRSITDGVENYYSVTYAYDNWNRLTNATAGAYTRQYLYDAFGNLKYTGGSGGPSPNYTLNYAINSTTAPLNNRLLSVTENGQTQPFTYDNAGNLTQGDGMTYAYDAANRMTSVNNGALGQYGYDGAGMRVKKVEGGGTTYYVRSSQLGNTAFEVTNAGVQRAYVYSGQGKLLAEQASDGQFYWMHSNHLHSARALTDTQGNLIYKGQFDPHGQPLQEWAAAGNTNLNARKFTGYERDVATGLDYANARTYTAGRGRFLQPDIAKNFGVPSSLNRYSYVRNDPVNFFDPTGLNLEYPGEGTCFRFHYYNPSTEQGFWGPWTCFGGGSAYNGGGPGYTGGGGEPGPDQFTSDMRKAMEDAFKDLGPGCKKFFDVGSTAKMQPVKDFINQIDFGRYDSTASIPSAPIYTYRGEWEGHRNTGRNDPAWSWWGPLANNRDMHKYKTIILGPAYFNPSLDTGHSEANDADYRRNTLVHEYMHVRWNATHGDLARDWHLGDKGYDVSTNDAAAQAVSDFIANDCGNKPQPK